MAWESTSPGRPFGGFVDATTITGVRVARVSAMAAVDSATDPDARIARVSAMAAVDSAQDPDARIARVSIMVAMSVPEILDGGWGVIPIG